MLEIYNEQVRDLLTKDNPKGGLPVRQNPKIGAFYVQGLKFVAVGSYIEIEKRTEEGLFSLLSKCFTLTWNSMTLNRFTVNFIRYYQLQLLEN